MFDFGIIVFLYIYIYIYIFQQQSQESQKEPPFNPLKYLSDTLYRLKGKEAK